jgi:hypothetical protein
MEIDQSLQIPPNDIIRVSVYAPLSALSRIFLDLLPVSPFEEFNVVNPTYVELARQISAYLFTPIPAAGVMPDPIRCYGYIFRDKYLSKDAQLMDVPIGGIHIIFDHQVSSDDEDPDVVHLWVNEELKVTGRKNHKTDRERAKDMVNMHKSIEEESEGGLWMNDHHYKTRQLDITSHHHHCHWQVIAISFLPCAVIAHCTSLLTYDVFTSYLYV